MNDADPSNAPPTSGQPSPITGDTPVAQAAWTLCRRELVRFLRQRARVTASIATPLMMWAVLGFGLQGSFQAPRAADAQDKTESIAAATPRESEPAAGQDGGYLAYLLPGMVLFTVLFTAIFSNISVIEDRDQGFLQAVLVAPTPRSAIALGKILGGAILGAGQGALLLLLAPWIGLDFGVLGFVGAVGIMLLVAFALTALGFVFAWRMESVAGFHGVMNLVLMPMWLLSGAMFPVAGASAGMRWVLYCNPLTYGLGALRYALGGEAHGLPGPFVCVCVTLAFALVMFVWAGLAVRPSAEKSK
jgi:ABC-2 type transport system permease protein